MAKARKARKAHKEAKARKAHKAHKEAKARKAHKEAKDPMAGKGLKDPMAGKGLQEPMAGKGLLNEEGELRLRLVSGQEEGLPLLHLHQQPRRYKCGHRPSSRRSTLFEWKPKITD